MRNLCGPPPSPPGGLFNHTLEGEALDQVAERLALGLAAGKATGWGYLAHHADPERRALATNPLAQVEAVHQVLRPLAIKGEWWLETLRRVVRDWCHPTCVVCAQRFRRENTTEGAHPLCAAAMPSDDELAAGR